MIPEEKIYREIMKLHDKVDAIHFDVKHVKKNTINVGDQRILDVYDVALMLKVSERQVRRLIQQRKIEGMKLGKRRLFMMNEIIGYINNLPK